MAVCSVVSAVVPAIAAEVPLGAALALAELEATAEPLRCGEATADFALPAFALPAFAPAAELDEPDAPHAVTSSAAPAAAAIVPAIFGASLFATALFLAFVLMASLRSVRSPAPTRWHGT
jgi:hypothetical protein